MIITSPINEFLSTVADRGLSLLGKSIGSKDRSVKGAVALCARLLSSRGNASGLALSYQILKTYGGFNAEEKKSFFENVLERFSCDQDQASACATAYLESKSAASLQELAQAATPQYANLISRLNQSPSSTMHILEMRTDLLGMLRETPELKTLDQAFITVLSAWFNRGFLGLRSIDWQTPATILENIIKYEAVHGIADWNDLGRRIKPNDRMIYGFFHPNLQDEPLIFVEVALTESIPNAIGPILSENRDPIDPKNATTAVFYSISNCQDGLRGIPLGNFLIKQVVEDLRQHFPQLKEFVTLSPIVKFGNWIRESEDYAGLLPEQLTDLEEDPDAIAQYENTLMPAAAWFLSEVKAKDGKPSDPVCRFHIGNGARLERLNWVAHMNDKGFISSYGIMANYKYIIDDIEKNHEAFECDNVVTVTSSIKKSASQSKTALALKNAT